MHNSRGHIPYVYVRDFYLFMYVDAFMIIPLAICSICISYLFIGFPIRMYVSENTIQTLYAVTISALSSWRRDDL